MKQTTFEKLCIFFEGLLKSLTYIFWKTVFSVPLFYKGNLGKFQLRLLRFLDRKSKLFSILSTQLSFKTLIASTVFGIIYALVYLVFIIIISIDIFSKKKLIECQGLTECAKLLVNLSHITINKKSSFIGQKELIENKNLNINIVYYKFLTINNYYREVKAANLFIIYSNFLHIMISLYSLLYDYLLKKATRTNMVILFLILSTTLNIFVTDYSFISSNDY